MIKKINTHLTNAIKQNYAFYEQGEIIEEIRRSEKLLEKIPFLPTSYIDKAYMKDLNFVKKLIKVGFYYFDYLPYEFANDIELLEYAISVKKVFIFQFMSENIRSDKNYIKKCLEINPFILINSITQKTLKDKQFLIELMQTNKKYSIYTALPKYMRNDIDLMKVAIKQNLANVMLIDIPQIPKDLHGNAKLSKIKQYLKLIGA